MTTVIVITNNRWSIEPWLDVEWTLF